MMRSFDDGIEFFSPFGGSALSCRVATDVLRIRPLVTVADVDQLLSTLDRVLGETAIRVR